MINGTKVIIVYPYRFRDFDYKRMDLACLAEKNLDVEVHELIDSIYPKFTKAYHVSCNSNSIKKGS